jgi:uncharacterized protein YceK
MTRRRTLLFVAAAVSLLGGCGTVLNLASKDPEIYGGPQKDLQFMMTPRNGGATQAVAVWPLPSGSAFAGAPAWLFPLVLADIPLSIVGDTLTLPLAIYLRQNEYPREDGTPAPSSGQVASPARPEAQSGVDGAAPLPQE